MTALPVVSGDECVRALRRGGFDAVDQRGSHVKLRGSDGRVLIVPLHRSLKTGTLRALIRQAGLTVEAFVALLRW